MKYYFLFPFLCFFLLLGAGCSSSNPQNTTTDTLFTNNHRTCTSEYENGGTTIMYTDGENVRLESVGLEMNTLGNATYYTIADSEWIYSWSSESDQGTKFPVIESEEEELNIDEEFDKQAFEEEIRSVDGYGEFTYSCERWNVDSSVFAPPSEITFTDYSDIFSL